MIKSPLPRISCSTSGHTTLCDWVSIRCNQWILAAAIVVSGASTQSIAAEPAPSPSLENPAVRFNDSKRPELHREAQRLAASGDVAGMEKLLCPESRLEGSEVLIAQATRLARVAVQLVESEKLFEAVPVAEASLQRVEQVENRTDPESEKWKLQAKITKVLIFEKVLFDKERAYLALRECAVLNPTRKEYDHRSDNLAPYLDNLRVYGTKTPALNRAYRGVGSGATMRFSSTEDQITVEITGLTGNSHRLESSTDLVHWGPVISGLRTGDFHQASVREPDQARFFRLHELALISVR